MSSFAIFLLSLLIFLHRVATSDPTEENGELNPFVEDTDGERLPFVKVIRDNERNALLSFLDNVNHNPSKIQWKESEKRHCTHWKGVYCDPSKTTVVQLSLPHMSFVGEIPVGTIGNLSNLLYLSLRGNGFRGRIPSDFFGLALSELYLNDNNFTGGLENINADHLEKLNVSNNALSSSIPTSLSKFPQSAFSGIKNLCGRPLRPCNRTTYVCLEPYNPRNTDNNKKRVTVSLSAGFGLFVILLSSVPKRIYKRINQPTKLALGARNTNFLWFDDRFNCVDCDKLLRASAEVLGKGSVGTSCKRVLEETKMAVVLKRLKDVTVPLTNFESHMEVLGKMKNENVVPLKGYCYSKDTKWLVYDYMPSGSLCAHLHESIPLDWDRRMRIALSAARGVAYLHLGNIVHGNIKSSNVFLREESNKDAVSDYGLHTLFDMLSSPNHWVTGYRAPEVINTKNFTFKSDVYRFSSGAFNRQSSKPSLSR
ncbi:putative inactive receptor kinase At2g26730 [Bidens hawaiensis]|uniref:putative inactive receptor kinase At2g26730 n=1 Tax=Bidens hawaiensis TaxID=980011 RepID=UPI00404A643F